jgi:DNA-binding NtrC family response regulator
MTGEAAVAERRRILVVDDERGVRALCTDVLKRAGYEAEAVDSPTAALSRLEEAEFDLILVDINMPQMSGIGLCRRIREKRPQQTVVLITGYPSINTAVNGIREGASDYLTKPFTPEALRDVVSRALSAS